MLSRQRPQSSGLCPSHGVGRALAGRAMGMDGGSISVTSPESAPLQTPTRWAWGPTPHRVTRCRLSPSLPPQYPVATPLSPLGVSGTSGRDPACCSPSAAPSPGLGTLLRVLGGPPSRGLHCSPPVPTALPRAVRPGGPRPPGVSLVPAGGASSSPGTRPQGGQGPRQLSALSRGFKARATCQGFLVAVQSGPGQRA